MASTPAPKPHQEVLPARQAVGKLTPIERAIERSDIKVDVAACIRWFWFGLAAFVTALTGLIIAIYTIPGTDPAKAGTPALERALVVSEKVAKRSGR